MVTKGLSYLNGIQNEKALFCGKHPSLTYLFNKNGFASHVDAHVKLAVDDEHVSQLKAHAYLVSAG